MRTKEKGRQAGHALWDLHPASTLHLRVRLAGNDEAPQGVTARLGYQREPIGARDRDHVVGLAVSLFQTDFVTQHRPQSRSRGFEGAVALADEIPEPGQNPDRYYSLRNRLAGSLRWVCRRHALSP